MRRAVFFAAALLFSGPAVAQHLGDAIGLILNADGTVQQEKGFVYPVATGKPHVCDDYYPWDANGAAGITKLRFRITQTGDVTYVFLHQSSGSQALDRAATACISSWKFEPFIANGTPVAVRAMVAIAWRADMARVQTPEQKASAANHPTRVAPQSIGKPHLCLEYLPDSAKEAGVQGTTTIAFTITTDGKTKDMRVERTSGNQALDDAAVTCARTWLYTPAMENGTPIEVPWKAEVAWMMK